MALVLTLTPSTVSVGQTFQAAVTGAAPGEVITFTYDAALPQSVTADAMGNASATFTGTTTGPVVAAGPTSGAATATLTISAAENCVITLSTTPAKPTAGQPVTVTATVTCNGAPVAGATVLFSTTGGPLGIGVTNAAGQASVTTSTLPAGANVITATVIAANTTCTCVGVSATATVNVGAAQSCVVTLSSTPAKPTAGQPVTVTATVTCNGAPVPGATVLFSTTGGPLGIGVTNAAGQASVTTSTLPAGANVITATVIAANTTCTCVGVSGTETVNVGASTGRLTANPACYTLNLPPLPWAFATATFSASGATPGAVVTFHLDGPSGPVVCTAVANASGNASCTATLNIGQVLYSSYTATTPSAGGTLSSSSTLGICLT
ncbi:Ig-like domain repeat protein [Streptomyces lydicus]|uniref:Ig-like domain repeat protein n=1 Tax=Streptomyces lydicus TaxID=47763 RepID=A0A3S9YLG7_9ACTN|nr:Ig-like domain-containing protein [Streptomyces lydicus]AZS75913.1 Ig-like domain repeat protein [Streptomyces lydicus]